MNGNYYCVILAGGIGSRLWPSSRHLKPKQFLDVLGTGESLLQATYKRYSSFIRKENIVVMSNEMYADLIREQLPEVAEENILLEPQRRNTVASVTWATLHIRKQNPEASMLITPADQMITDEKALKEDVMEGFAYVSASPRLLTMGVMPSRPETMFGYIQMADECRKDIFKVKSFTEKPETEFARMFCDSGEFLWNTGLYMWNADALIGTIKQLSNGVVDLMDNLKEMLDRGLPVSTVVHDAFSRCPNLPLETGVLEKMDNVDVLRCHFRWTDLGSWHELYGILPKDKEHNVSIGCNSLFYNCDGCLVKLPAGKVVVLQDLHDYVVVEEDNVLVVCRKDDQQSIRKFVNDVQLNAGDDFV